MDRPRLTGKNVLFGTLLQEFLAEWTTLNPATVARWPRFLLDATRLFL